ncbi:putative zinc finger, CCHC-type containing protein [Tanacetum coccineum]
MMQEMLWYQTIIDLHYQSISYTHTTSPSLNIWASEQRRLKPSTRKEPTFSQESQSIADVVASTKTPDVLPIRKKKFLAEFKRTGKRLGTTCDDKYMQIKCKDKGHFARNCPDKKRSQALVQALNQVEPVDVFDLESLYSLDDEPSDLVLCTIAYSDFSSDDDSDTDSLESDSDFGVHVINPIPHVLPIQEDPPLPTEHKFTSLTDAYAKDLFRYCNSLILLVPQSPF